jgi:hypothetical protein
MASQPTIPEVPLELELDASEPRLTREEGWELIFSLFGSGREMYAKAGGAEAFIKAERAAWDDDHEYR